VERAEAYNAAVRRTNLILHGPTCAKPCQSRHTRLMVFFEGETDASSIPAPAFVDERLDAGRWGEAAGDEPLPVPPTSSCAPA